MPTINLKIVAHDDTLLKVVWAEDGLCFPPYFVFRNQLKAASDTCKEFVDDLVNAYLDQKYDDYAGILSNLANAGSALYYLLFMGAAQNGEYARDVQAWLNTLASPTRLTISSDASIHIPWSLVFVGDVHDLAGTAEYAQFVAFWAIRYELSVIYSGMGPKPLRHPLARNSFWTQTILHHEAFSEGEKVFNGPERVDMDSFLLNEVGKATTWKECTAQWTQLAERDCLVYVFAHANGTSIHLSDDEKITVVDMRRYFLELRRQHSSGLGPGVRTPQCLFVLNGCKTAVGNLDNSFLTATAESGCCGFIGSDTEIPTRFAIRFGLALLKHLYYAGASALEAMQLLRREHWPLSLLYNCYCHPDFRIEPSNNHIDDQAEDRLSDAEKAQRNYSFH